MAGSYNHVVNHKGQLLNNENFVNMIENLGDAYEMAEEMYGMIWFLADGSANKVEAARKFYIVGTEMSPGKEPDAPDDPMEDFGEWLAAERDQYEENTIIWRTLDAIYIKFLNSRDDQKDME